MFKYLGNLRRIRDDYLKLVEESMAQKALFNQAEIAAVHEEATLFLNDDTRINNSFINESQQKHSHTGVSNTPSKTPSRLVGKSRSGQKHRRDDSMTNSQLIGSIERQEEKTPNTSVYGGNDSIFLKSHDFPKMMKRQKQRNYTKILIPFLVVPDSKAVKAEDHSTILDLYKINRSIKIENKIEHLEGTSLIRNLKKPVIIKRSLEEIGIKREIMTQLVFYENEISFSENCLAKMKDFFNTGGLFHVVYDKPGEPLSTLAISGGSFTNKQLLGMLSNLCSALTCLHNLGLVHAKLNPESVFFKYDSKNDAYLLTLTNFEQCFFEGEAPDSFVADSFSAPEIVCRGEGPDRKADYWSFGCAVFYLLTGLHLFPTKSFSGMIFMVVLCHQMTQLSFDQTDLLTLYPEAKTKLEKLTEANLQQHQVLVAARKEALADLEARAPAFSQLLSDCLRIDPRDRSLGLPLSNF